MKQLAASHAVVDFDPAPAFTPPQGTGRALWALLAVAAGLLAMGIALSDVVAEPGTDALQRRLVSDCAQSLSTLAPIMSTNGAGDACAMLRTRAQAHLP